MIQDSIDKKIEQVKEEIELAEKCMTELKEKRSELQKLAESLEATKAKQSGRVKHGRIYWYIDDIGQIVSVTECNSLSDNYRYEIGNYYLTPEDANRAEEQIRLFRLLDRFSKQHGWTDDIWEDDQADKFYIYMNYDEEELCSNAVTYFRDTCQVYFKTKEATEAAIEKYHDLIMDVVTI